MRQKTLLLLLASVVLGGAGCAVDAPKNTEKPASVSTSDSFQKKTVCAQYLAKRRQESNQNVARASDVGMSGIEQVSGCYSGKYQTCIAEIFSTFSPISNPGEIYYHIRGEDLLTGDLLYNSSVDAKGAPMGQGADIKIFQNARDGACS